MSSTDLRPNMCPECLKAGVVATRNGPTCAHQANEGLKWFPHLWEKMEQHERVAWLQKNQERKK